MNIGLNYADLCPCAGKKRCDRCGTKNLQPGKPGLHLKWFHHYALCETCYETASTTELNAMTAECDVEGCVTCELTVEGITR
jgi:hypothetical protein